MLNPRTEVFFNKKKNLRQSTVDKNLLLPKSYFPTLPSFFLTSLDLTTLWTVSFYNLKQISEDASIYTKATVWSLVICSQVHKRYPLTPREKQNKQSNQAKPATATK